MLSNKSPQVIDLQQNLKRFHDQFETACARGKRALRNDSRWVPRLDHRLTELTEQRLGFYRLFGLRLSGADIGDEIRKFREQTDAQKLINRIQLDWKEAEAGMYEACRRMRPLLLTLSQNSQEMLARVRLFDELSRYPLSNSDEISAVVGKLMGSTPAGTRPRTEAFPTPSGTTWKDVSITFISDLRVQIVVLGVKDTRNYAEMGFGDQRCAAQKPKEAWACLKLLASNGGTIKRPASFEKLGWTKVEKQIQFIRAALRELFNIPDDPLPARKGSGYEAQFKIKLTDSYEH